jgi:hypothetical protein
MTSYPPSGCGGESFSSRCNDVSDLRRPTRRLCEGAVERLGEELFRWNIDNHRQVALHRSQGALLGLGPPIGARAPPRGCECSSQGWSSPSSALA